MDQWLSSLSPLAAYLVAATAIMLGAALLCGGIILLLERRKMTDSEKLAAIKKVLDRADLAARPHPPRRNADGIVIFGSPRSGLSFFALCGNHTLPSVSRSPCLASLP